MTLCKHGTLVGTCGFCMEDEARKSGVCRHGVPACWPCGICAADAAPKCRHGNAFACGFCLAETGSAIVRPRPLEGKP